MTDTFKNLGSTPSQIAATATTIYTAPTGTGLGAIIKEIRIVNTDTAASHYFTLYKNGTAAANQITGQITLQPNETFLDTGPIILGSAGTIAGLADVAAKLTISLGGLEIT